MASLFDPPFPTQPKTTASKDTTTATTTGLVTPPPTSDDQEDFLQKLKNLPFGHHTFNEIAREGLRVLRGADKPTTQDNQFPLYRISLYRDDTRSLVVSKASEAHVYLCKVLDQEIQRQTSTMGPAAPSLECVWSPAFSSFNDHNRLVGDAEADMAYIPGEDTDGTPAKHPAVIVEVGSSDSWDALHAKASAWFRLFEGGIGIIILIREHWESCTIGIEVWKEVGATPRCVQSITIGPQDGRWEGDTLFPDPDLYEVQGGGIRLGFNDIFGREPRPGSGEGDIVFGEEWLKWTTMRTWIAEKMNGRRRQP